MKKIMIFIGVYIPGKKFGGPVTSIYNFTECLGDDYELSIVCSDHDYRDIAPYEGIKEGWNRVGKARVLYLPDKELGYSRFYEILKSEKPDMIYASGIMYIQFNHGVIKAAKRLNIPVLLAPRGDICDNAIKIKSWKKIPFLHIARILKIFDGLYFQATVDEEVKNLKKYLKTPNDKIFEIPNIPVIPSQKGSLEKEKGKIKIVFISRVHFKKNLLLAIKAVNAMKSDVTFDIYGPIEGEEYWEECKALIGKAPSNIKIEYKGVLEAGTSGEGFKKYDCFVFPTLTENYGHVIAEALLHDCPVILSKGTTPWDDMADAGAGYVIDLLNEAGFTKALEEVAALDTEGYTALINKVRAYTKTKINTEDLKNQYKEVLEEIMK